MRSLCILLAVITGLLALALAVGSRSAIHEILAAVMMLIAVVLSVAAGVARALADIKAELVAIRTSTPPVPASKRDD